MSLLIIGVSWTTVKILNKNGILIKIFFLILFISITLLRLFISIDPVSIKLWGTTNILGQTFFSPYGRPTGYDGITYNMQYLFLVRDRSDKILKARHYVISSQCQWIFPDPNNDYKILSILNLNIDNISPCHSNY